MTRLDEQRQIVNDLDRFARSWGEPYAGELRALSVRLSATLSTRGPERSPTWVDTRSAVSRTLPTDPIDHIPQQLRAAARTYIERHEADREYATAVCVVIGADKATVSWVQRRLKLPYLRAEALVERMTRDGYIDGPTRTVADSEATRAWRREMGDSV